MHIYHTVVNVYAATLYGWRALVFFSWNSFLGQISSHPIGWGASPLLWLLRPSFPVSGLRCSNSCMMLHAMCSCFFGSRITRWWFQLSVFPISIKSQSFPIQLNCMFQISIKWAESWNRHLENRFTLDGSLQTGVETPDSKDQWRVGSLLWRWQVITIFAPKKNEQNGNILKSCLMWVFPCNTLDGYESCIPLR